MIPQELNEFWSLRLLKIWVVDLSGIGKNNKTDKKIVRAKTKQTALLCAKENSLDFYNKKCTGTARLADPETDLHCIKVPVEIANMDISNFNEKGMAHYLSLLSSNNSRIQPIKGVLENESLTH